MIIVDKVWGRELWIANCKDYCGKILELKGGYGASVHYHKIKRETFFCFEGRVIISIGDVKQSILSDDEPITIEPRQIHSFWSYDPAKLFEVSTIHDDSDTYRLEESCKLKTFCFDLDGVICSNTYGKYETATPNMEMIREVNKLYNRGHIILIYTSRGTTTGIDQFLFTKKQLERWGVRHNQLIMGKPEADLYIDDRAINIKDWHGTGDS